MSDKGRDEVMGHAEDNDGIEEYDNPLPDWWLGMFIFCILWGIGYGIEYHFITHRSQVAAYNEEMAQAAVQWPTPEVTVGQVADLSPETLTLGADVYKTNCVSCHKADLSGGIGPNLKDDTWIHGGTLEDITRTITEGVPDKGMLTWGPILGPEKISQVAAYVYSEGPKLTGPAKGAAEATPPATPAPPP